MYYDVVSFSTQDIEKSDETVEKQRLDAIDAKEVHEGNVTEISGPRMMTQSGREPENANERQILDIRPPTTNVNDVIFGASKLQLSLVLQIYNIHVPAYN